MFLISASWPSYLPFGPDPYRWEHRICAYSLAAIAGLLAADCLTGTGAAAADLRKVKWPATIALLTGIATGLTVAGTGDDDARSGFIPAYLAALGAQAALQQTARLSRFLRRFRS